MLFGETLRLGDLLQVLRRLLLVAGPADGCEPFRVVRVIGFLAQCEGRAVVEHKEPDDQPGAAVRLLSEHDLGPKAAGKDAPLAAGERMVAQHRCPPQTSAAGSAAPFGFAGGLAWLKAISSSGSAPISVALARKAASSAARASSSSALRRGSA